MLTLDELCADLNESGRTLTPRGARDWWTKGLLPRPQRRGLGRGRGTETFWTEPQIREQARAAYDFLGRHSRSYSALVSLWLSGFRIETAAVRAVYGKLISRNLSWVRSTDPDENPLVGKLAEGFARRFARSKNAPADVRHAVTDLAIPYLELLFAPGEAFDADGLSTYWRKMAPYFFGRDDTAELAAPMLSDQNLDALSQRIEAWFSFSAQQEAIVSANDYELMRARRIVRFAFGVLGRLSRATRAQGTDDLEEACRPLLIVFGRPAVPILILVLREQSSRDAVISFVLEAARMLRKPVDHHAWLARQHAAS